VNTNMTRRTFGGLVAATVLLPSIGFASPNGYAFPELLQSVEDLIPVVGWAPDGRPEYEAAGMIVIDVRTREEFEAGHVPGARHLEPNAVVAGDAPVAGELRAEAEIVGLLEDLGVSTTRRIVLYDDRGGFHAARMFWLLEYLGHGDVAVLNGGYSAWVAADGPVATAALKETAAAFSPAPMPRRLGTADYVLSHRGNSETVVIDVRPPDLFAKGHIPWAMNIPWSKNLGENGLFLPADALRAHFEAHGVTPDRNVVIHCQEGLASSHSYVALRLLGYPRVRVYHRSWAEWGNDPTLPRAAS